MRRLRHRYRRRGHSYASEVTYVVQRKIGKHWQDFSRSFKSLEAANEYRRESKEDFNIPFSHTQVKMYLPGDYMEHYHI